MLKPLFWRMLAASTNYYGDSIGLAPIALGKVRYETKNTQNKDFWSNECASRPNRIACLNYDS